MESDNKNLPASVAVFSVDRGQVSLRGWVLLLPLLLFFYWLFFSHRTLHGSSAWVIVAAVAYWIRYALRTMKRHKDADVAIDPYVYLDRAGITILGDRCIPWSSITHVEGLGGARPGAGTPGRGVRSHLVLGFASEIRRNIAAAGHLEMLTRDNPRLFSMQAGKGVRLPTTMFLALRIGYPQDKLEPAAFLSLDAATIARFAHDYWEAADSSRAAAAAGDKNAAGAAA